MHLRRPCHYRAQPLAFAAAPARPLRPALGRHGLGSRCPASVRVGAPVSRRKHVTIAKTVTEDPTDKLESGEKPESSSWFETEGELVRVRIGNAINVEFPGKYFLYFVPFLWGTFGPAVRLMFSLPNPPEPAVFNTARLLLSATVYLPVLIPLAIRSIAPADEKEDGDVENKDGQWFRGGVELGIYVFIANVVQVIGLEQTSAGRAAFLNQLQTVFVPVLAAIFGIEAIDILGWGSAALAVVGVAILSSDKASGTVASLTGDSLEITSAFFFALYILRVGFFASKANTSYMVGTKVVTQAILSLIWAGWGFFSAGSHSGVDSHAAWGWYDWAVVCGVVGWTGLFSSALSGVLQATGQKSTSGSETAVILATQPIWASGLSALLLGEQFSERALIGGAAILGATLLSSLKGPEEDAELQTEGSAKPDETSSAKKRD